MGMNKRYPGHDLDRPIEGVVVRPEPLSLTREEVNPERYPITRAPEPIRARAWVRFHEATIHPEVEVIEWNAIAVRVRWTMHSGQVKTAWVWKGAVESRGGSV
jgi:hypothetical protein